MQQCGREREGAICVVPANVFWCGKHERGRDNFGLAYSRIFFARSTNRAGVFRICSAAVVSVAPEIGPNSVREDSTSRRKRGSFMVASKAVRNAATRSAGVSGG